MYEPWTVTFSDVRDAAEVDAAQIGVRKVDALLAGDRWRLYASKSLSRSDSKGRIVEETGLSPWNAPFRQRPDSRNFHGPFLAGTVSVVPGPRQLRPMICRQSLQAQLQLAPILAVPIVAESTKTGQNRGLSDISTPRGAFCMSSCWTPADFSDCSDLGRLMARIDRFVAAAQCVAAEPKSYSPYDEQVRPIVEQMTLEEKIGQMTQPELGHLKDHLEDIEKYHVGSVLSGGGSDPDDGNSLEAWTDAYDACQQRALKTRLGIPILYGIDGVHGHNNVIGAVIFPHHVGLGCTRDPELVEEVGRITAAEIRATGIQWTFAPCVTVPRDERWGRTYEGFSEDPDVVCELGEAMTRGLQGERLSDPLGRRGVCQAFRRRRRHQRSDRRISARARPPSATRATASTSR